MLDASWPTNPCISSQKTMIFEAPRSSGGTGGAAGGSSTGSTTNNNTGDEDDSTVGGVPLTGFLPLPVSFVEVTDESR